MAIVYPAKGDKWAAFECVQIELVNNEWWDEEQEWTVAATEARYTLRCKCGKLVAIDHHNWKGLLSHVDCGCGASGMKRSVGQTRKYERAHKAEKKCSFAVYMSLEKYERLKALADRADMNLSPFVVSLIELALGETLAIDQKNGGQK